jgi:GNAT superfamily N-acetyltransferase
MGNWQIKSLSSAHQRSSFCCGKPSLDDFIRRFAMQYERRNIVRTYVAIEHPDPAVLGYYSLAGGSVTLTTLPDTIAQKLPRHRVPMAHLARLAVDQNYRGQGMGEELLFDALRRCWRFSTEMGLFAVDVYALDEDAKRFYEKYGFKAFVDDDKHLYLAMTTVKKLLSK